LNHLPNRPKPEKEFSKALIPGKAIIGTMRGRMLVCIILGLLAVTPALAPASERAGNTGMGMPAGWSDEINLSMNTMTDKYPSIAFFNQICHVVWQHTYVSSVDWEIVYSKSSDNGHSWTPYVNISSSNSYITYPDIGTCENNIHVVWEDQEGASRIDYRNSSDGGNTWNPIKRISSYTGAVVVGPKLFVNNSNIHIIWWDQRDGADGEIYYRRSLDGGITFDNGQGVDEDRRLTFSPALTGGINIAGAGSNISISWSDERDGDLEKYWMISKDNGYTWENGVGIENEGRKLTEDSIDCGAGAIAINASKIHIIWEDQSWPGPEYRIYYRNSTDNGMTWNPIQLLTGPSPLIASPDISTWGDKIHIVWDDARDDGITTEIYYKNSTDGGTTWNSDIRLTNSTGYDSLWPRIAVNDTTKHVTWWDLRDGNREIYYKRYPDVPTPTYTIPLSQGWNLLSTPLIPSDGSINKVLENITGKWDYIQLYNSTDSDHWKTNLTYRPEQLNDLNSLDYRMGFWINITEPGVSLTLKGQIPDNTVIPLYAGWNLVGYPTLNDTMTVGNALWGTGADRVEVFDATDPYRLKEVTSTYIMKPGEGYWIHVPADSVWIVDW
jgi:hypothetical protein